MARTVDEMPPRQGWSKYPWEEWMDGQIWELSYGEDFDCAPQNFVIQCHNKAKLLNCRVETRTIDEIVYIQAYAHGERD